MKNKIDHELIALFANEIDEGLRRKLLSKLVCNQSVLSKTVVELVQN